MSIREEAVEFFSKNSAYRKFFEDCAKKYESYESLTGSISLERYTLEEIEELAGFLGLSFFELRKKNKVSVRQWLKHYENSRFAKVDFLSLLSEVLGKALFGRSTLRGMKLEKREEFFLRMQTEYRESFDFIDDLNFIHTWFREYEKGELTEEDLQFLNKAIMNLPYLSHTYLYLPVFAHFITGNPHAFDYGSYLGNRLFRMLELNYKRRFTLQKTEDEFMAKSEAYHKTLHFYGILPDDVWNFVTLNSMLAFTKGKLNSMWEAACKNKVSWNVPLKHIAELDEVKPYLYHSIFIVENSGVYSMLVSHFPDVSFLCTHGQFRYAFLNLMEKIPEEVKLYYTGDFDAEGLKMADNLKRRFPGRIDLSYMGVESYLLSQPEERAISDKSLKILDSIFDKELKKVAELIKKEKKYGYQEALFEEYCKAIRRIKSFE